MPICENDMHRNGNLGFKMGVSPVAHVPTMQYTRSPPPPGGGGGLEAVKYKENNMKTYDTVDYNSKINLNV